MGSNLGDRERNLRLAIRSLEALLQELVVSSPFLTQPLHHRSQPRFLNAAVVGLSESSAEDLMALAKGLEWAVGRRPGTRYGPRPLDIDLLLMGDRLIRRPELSVPHPRLRQRRFALAPLAEIAPELRVPPDGQTVRGLLANLEEPQQVTAGAWTLSPLSPSL